MGKTSIRFGVMMFFALVASACAGSQVTETGQEPDATGEQGPGEFVIQVELSGSAFPPFDEFDIELAPVVSFEEVSAVGKLNDTDNLIGSNCDELLAMYPEIIECEEFTDISERTGEGVDIGPLNSDGTVTVPALETDSRVRVEALTLFDELCSMSSFADVSPGQTEVTIVLDSQDVSCS